MATRCVAATTPTALPAHRGAASAPAADAGPVTGPWRDMGVTDKIDHHMSEGLSQYAATGHHRVEGFILLQRELDTGQLAWTWLSPHDEPQPQFLTRREAIAYMSEKLGTLR